MSYRFPTLTAANQRLFNVSINGVAVLSQYDVFKAAGAKNKAIVVNSTRTANSAGQYVIKLTSVVNNSLLSGVSIE